MKRKRDFFIIKKNKQKVMFILKKKNTLKDLANLPAVGARASAHPLSKSRILIRLNWKLGQLGDWAISQDGLGFFLFILFLPPPPVFLPPSPLCTPPTVMFACMTCFLPCPSTNLQVSSSTEAETICSLGWPLGKAASRARISAFSTFKQAAMLDQLAGLEEGRGRQELISHSLSLSLCGWQQRPVRRVSSPSPGVLLSLSLPVSASFSPGSSTPSSLWVS